MVKIKIFLIISIALLIVLFAGCGGSSALHPPSEILALRISDVNSTIAVGHVASFAVTNDGYMWGFGSTTDERNILVKIMENVFTHQ